jgi:uncharacterized membrane protein (DUF2068 family)
MRTSSELAGIRLIALVEAAKALLVLSAGFGLLSLIHHDVEATAARWLARLHLNPANRNPQIFLDAVSRATDARLWLMAGLALIYAIVRAAMAWGLWFDRPWAEWFAVVGAGIYFPIEVYELWRGVTAIKISALVINLAIVAFIGWRLGRRSDAASDRK